MTDRPLTLVPPLDEDEQRPGYVPAGADIEAEALAWIVAASARLSTGCWPVPMAPPSAIDVIPEQALGTRWVASFVSYDHPPVRAHRIGRDRPLNGAYVHALCGVLVMAISCEAGVPRCPRCMAFG